VALRRVALCLIFPPWFAVFVLVMLGWAAVSLGAWVVTGEDQTSAGCWSDGRAPDRFANWLSAVPSRVLGSGG